MQLRSGSSYSFAAIDPVQMTEENKNTPTFKEIKCATEAMTSVMPKYSGENPNEFFSQWALKYTREANNLQLGKTLSALVLPRLLTGKAAEKHYTLDETEKKDTKRALEKLSQILVRPENKNKALNSFATLKKKESESVYAFGKRVSDLSKIAHPTILASAREELSINRFIQGLPNDIRMKMKEGETFRLLSKAVERAETLEEIQKEDTEESINVLQKICDEEKNSRLEHLERKVEKLQLENKKLQEQYGQRFHTGNRNFQGRNHGNSRNFQGSGQRNFQKRENSGNQDSQTEPRGWQINRAPRTTGLNFLMIVAIMTIIVNQATAQMQICTNEKSGEYFAAPTPSLCQLDKEEKVIKTPVGIWTEFGASKKVKAFRCSKTFYDFCFITSWTQPNKFLTENLKSIPMTKTECDEAIAHHTVNKITLVAKGNNIFQTPADDDIWFTFKIGKSCERRHIYTLEKGEVATPDGRSIVSGLGDVSGCEAQSGECNIIDSRLIWDKEGIKDFCKYSFVQNTTALITKSKVALPEMQMALSIEQDQSGRGSYCIPNLKVIMNNGFILSINSPNITLEELITEVSEKRRFKRNAKDFLIKRIFGDNATHENYPYFSVDPIIDPRIIDEMRRFGVTYGHIRHQWENYNLPNKQTATLRAIREAEYRHQMIKHLREKPADEDTPAQIKRMEEPNEIFNGLLAEEFGATRKLDAQEKANRKWFPTTVKTTRSPVLREQAGENYVRTISEESRRATENKGNAQLNSRVQYVTNMMSETRHAEFDKIYQHLCEIQNSQIEISRSILAIDPTWGIRSLLKRDDVVARRAGNVYIVTQCRNVTVDKIHLDHRVNNTCYQDTPVTVQNTTWFIAPGFSKDLVKESKTIPCEEVILGVYQNEKGEWISHNGIATVRKIGIQFSTKPEKQNLTLSAPPSFAKLENVDNPTAYLSAHLNSIIILRENQRNLARTMEDNGMRTPEIEEIINAGIKKISSITDEIESSIERGKQFFKDHIVGLLKTVVVPIIVVIAVGGMIYVILKIYFLKRAAGTALTQFAKIARRAPPSVQSLMKRMRPEINNIVLNDDSDEDFEMTELQQHQRGRQVSLISEPEVYSLSTRTGKSYLPYIPVKLEGDPIIALIDSASSVSLITEKTAKSVGRERIINPTNCSAKVANGTKLKFLGEIQLTIFMGNTGTEHKFYVVQDEQAPAPCVIGADLILRYNSFNRDITINLHKRMITVGGTYVKMFNRNEIHNLLSNKETVQETEFELFDAPKSSQADPSQADSSQADSSQADSSQADSSQADPSQADSSQADPSQADSSQADPRQDDKSQGQPVQTGKQINQAQGKCQDNEREEEIKSNLEGEDNGNSTAWTGHGQH